MCPAPQAYPGRNPAVIYPYLAEASGLTLGLHEGKNITLQRVKATKYAVGLHSDMRTL